MHSKLIKTELLKALKPELDLIRQDGQRELASAILSRHWKDVQEIKQYCRNVLENASKHP